MAITNIKISNFKSFKDLDLNLGQFNVVIGANASGKSNFVEVFRFLRAIEDNNLDDAISLHGGRDSILNKRLSPSEPLRIRTVCDQQMTWGGSQAGLVYETSYEFCLEIGSFHDGVIVKDDRFSQKLRTGTGDGNVELRLDVLMSEGKRRIEISPQDAVNRIREKESLLNWVSLLRSIEDIRSLSSTTEARKLPTLLIHGFLAHIVMYGSLFERLGVYDIAPRAVKRPDETSWRTSLQENGENLALVLRQVLADPEKSRKFHNLLRYMLPFAVEIGTEQSLEKSVLLNMREEYYDSSLLANLLSDGTVDIAALITALFFEDKDVVIIEEPERNIHPHLISGLIELMKDASRNKQVIITTHSPEVVRHAGLENLLLMSRDKEGFSTVSRPAEKQDVKVFLENDLGLDTVFVQELWGR